MNHYRPNTYLALAILAYATPFIVAAAALIGMFVTDSALGAIAGPIALAVLFAVQVIADKLDR